MKPWILTVLACACCACESTPTAPTRQPTPPPAAAVLVLSGVVTNLASGFPLTGILVEWKKPEESWGERGPGVTTDVNGGYWITLDFPDQPATVPFRLQMRASKEGYQPQTADVMVPALTTVTALTVNFDVLRVGYGIVSGIVTVADSGQPLAGAEIEWAGLAEAWGDRGPVATDRDGGYRLVVSRLGGPGSAEGLFFMRASAEGYAPQTVELTLAPAITLNFSLTRADR